MCKSENFPHQLMKINLHSARRSNVYKKHFSYGLLKSNW